MQVNSLITHASLISSYVYRNYTLHKYDDTFGLFIDPNMSCLKNLLPISGLKKIWVFFKKCLFVESSFFYYY